MSRVFLFRKRIFKLKKEDYFVLALSEANFGEKYYQARKVMPRTKYFIRIRGKCLSLTSLIMLE